MKVQDFYDRFWRNMDTEVSDQRTLERAEIASRLLTKKEGDLLDVGCGTGIATLFFQRKGFRTEGVDVSSEAVRISRAKGVEARVLDMTRDALTGEYDVIACFELLEHLVDPLSALGKMKGALKASGELLISLPNDFHLVRRFQILFGVGRFGGYDSPHIRFFDRRQALRLIEASGLRADAVSFAPLAPPRMRTLSRMCHYLARLCPDLFAIAYVFRLTR